MKLFQKLIAAPAIISLASGFAVNASEINTSDLGKFSNTRNLVSLENFKSDTLFPGDWAYDSLKDLTNSPKFNGNKVSRLEAAAELSNLIAGGEGLINGPAIDRLSDELGSELAIMKGRVDGLEARVNTIEAGSFSETSTASFKVQMAIGAVDGKDIQTGVTDGDEDVQFQYTFDTKIKTSFTGEDALSVAIDSGSTTAGPTDEFGLNNTSDFLKVDGVAYSFPIGDKITALISDGVDGSKIFTTACTYGGPSDTLDDCGNVNANIDNAGVTAMAEYDFDNGLTAAIGYAGNETGIMTKEKLDAYGANLAYTGDSYGVSLTYGNVEAGTNGIEHNAYTALNAYYSFDNGIGISGAYEWGDIAPTSTNSLADKSVNYFVGVSGEVGPGELGAALGTHGGQATNATTEVMYEAYYSYPVNDGVTITPLVFVKEKATAGTPDETGVMVKTSFSF
jgi:hypothetical protein